MYNFPHPRELALLVPSESSMEKVKSLAQINVFVPEELRCLVNAEGVQQVVDAFAVRDNPGDYDINLFIERLPPELFPPELIDKFLNWARREMTGEDDNLPVVYLYQFLWPIFFEAKLYPTKDKSGKDFSMTIYIPTGTSEKLRKVVKGINWDQCPSDQWTGQILKWIASHYSQDDFMWFFRTTSWEAATKDMEIGMNETCQQERLLEFGMGTYFATDLEYAIWWMKKYHPKGYGRSVTIFRLPKNIVENLPAKKYLDEEEWKVVVYNHLNNIDHPFHQGIFGYCASNTTVIPKKKWPKFKVLSGKKCHQLCLKTADMCLKFLQAADITVVNFPGKD